MVVLDIYTKSLKQYYKTTILSKATVFILVTELIAIIFPFIFAYRSRGFWLKHDTYYEQPNIRYKHEYLFMGITNNNSNAIICNNIYNFQEFKDYDTCNIIKVRELDNNLDGKMDELNFQIFLDLNETEKLMHFTLLLTIDYKLSMLCPLRMEAGIIIQQNLNFDLTQIDIVSELKLIQKFPLKCHSRGMDLIYNESLITDKSDYSSYRLNNIMNSYFKRNITTQLGDIYSTFTMGKTETFNINLRVIYPEHKIYYRPGFWQILKWGWIQYFAIYIVFKWAIKKIKNYVFDNNLVLFYKVSPIKKNI